MKTKLLMMSFLTMVMSFFGCSAGAQTQMPQGELLELEYKRSGTMAGYAYYVRVERTDNGDVVLRAMQESYGPLYEKTLTTEELQGFVQIIEEEQMYDYGYSYEPEFDVLDGYAWGFTARFADTAIISHGSNAGPSGDGLRRIREYSEQLAKEGQPFAGEPELE